MRDIKTFFQYVIPSVLSFALSGIYTIADGFFVGNNIGDMGLSAVNIAYPRAGYDLVEHGAGEDFVWGFRACLKTACR